MNFQSDGGDVLVGKLIIAVVVLDVGWIEIHKVEHLAEIYRK